jgi:hypothetical protein
VLEKWAGSNWTRGSFEFAGAFSTTSADPSGQDPKFDKGALWATNTWGYQDWGQVLVGLNGQVTEGAPSVLSAAGRFYGGNKRAKGYVETQGTWQDSAQTTFLGGAGFEATPVDWVWLDFTFGFEGTVNTIHGKASFKLKTSLPGK